MSACSQRRTNAATIFVVAIIIYYMIIGSVYTSRFAVIKSGKTLPLWTALIILYKIWATYVYEQYRPEWLGRLILINLLH